MTRPLRNRPLVIALYANAALLAAILLVLLARGSSPSMLPAAFGANSPPIAGGNGVYVMPAQFLDRLWGCYVIDTDAQTLCAYAFYGNSTKPELKLIGARNYCWDRKLNNFNTGPDPDEVRKWIQVQEEPIRGVNPPKTKPDGQ